MAGKDFSVVVNIGGKVQSSLAAAVNSAKSQLTGLTNHFKAQAAAQRAAIRGMLDTFKGVAAMAAAGGMIFSIKKMIGDGEELSHELQALKNAGRTTQEVAAGIAEANKAIRAMPTANLTNSIKILNETTGAFGDYHHAVENLQFNSKLGDVMKNTLGIEDPAHALGSLIKALEIRGSASNPETYRREAGELQRAMTFFGGRLTPDMIYAFASNAQQGIRQLDERFLTKIAPSMIQEMGGEKVGTGLTAFRTIISGRKITDKKQAEAWQKLGLLNPRDVIKNKMGDVTGWRDGAIQGTRLAYQDPFRFMEEVILPRLQKQGTDITDPIKLGAALTTLFKNTKANAFVTAIATVVDRTRLKKDEALIQKVLDVDKNYDESLLNDPKLAKFAIVQAMRNIGAALALPMMKPMAQMLISIARAVNQVSAALMEHPGAARVLSGIGAALTAMAALRLANLIFGISGLARAIVLLATASTLGLATRLISVSRGIAAISYVATVGLARRLALSAGALMMLGRVGGIRAMLSAVAMGLAGLGLSVLRFPLVALRGIGAGLLALAANPVGIAITAVVTALTALGVWVANNWGGLKTFLAAFGPAFMKGLGPGSAQAVQNIVTKLNAVFDWLTNLLGPIDEVGTKWASWGASAGAAAAKVVNALATLPAEIGRLAQEGYNAIVNIDWKAAGLAIVNGIISGIASMGSAIGDAVKGGVAGAASALGGAAAKAGAAVKSGATWLHDKLLGSAPSARAMGGPVSAGLPYLVGERGPEIFVPNTHGSIKTNGYLNGLGGVGGPSVDVSAVNRAASAARQTGQVLHASLDATRKPVIDTTSIDEATAKATKLASLISTINGSEINVGGLGGGAGGFGGGGGGGGGSWNGKALAVGNGAGIGHAASQAERAAYIQESAKRHGVDPKTALRVAQSEGFGKYVGDYGTSFGDFQLHYGGGGPRGMRVGGLGDTFSRTTGLSARDPKTWKAQTDFAMAQAARGGWGPWHGAARVGIGNWQGIRGRRAMGGPVSAGGSYLVGERGPEIFTPGASGGISTNDVLRTLKEGDGSFVPSPEAVAKHRPQRVSSSVRGDTHYSPSFKINGAKNPEETKRQVEAHFWDLVRQAESEQRGLLSD